MAANTCISPRLPLGCAAVFFVAFLGATALFCCCGASPATARAPARISQQAAAAHTQTPITRYTLPPEKLRQAVELARTGRELYFAEFGVSVLVLIVLLRSHGAAKFRDWAVQVSRFRIVQASIFAALLLLALDLAALPLHVWGHVLGLRYNLSVEGWGPWLLDWAKSQAIVIAVGAFVAWIVAGLLKRSPRRWWFAAWLIALPLIFFAAFIEPVVIEPLFYDFQPLSKSHPELARKIEEVATRAGAQIPEDHIFEMLASRKLNELNAYVSGIGASKRVVLWDTLMSRMTDDEVLLVVGHELGHYVLGHIWRGIVISAVGLFFGLWLSALLLNWAIGRWGPSWHIRDVNDWAALAALWLLGSLVLFASTPLDNAISRYFEHQADVFGIEVAHGIVPDVPQVAARADQILGEVDLEEPDPSPLTVFWFDDHPPIAKRIEFDLEYDPWSPGHAPEFIRH